MSRVHEERVTRKLTVTVRGPGGPFQKADHNWARALRRDGASLRVIASYFEPAPTFAALRAALSEGSGSSSGKDS